MERESIEEKDLGHEVSSDGGSPSTAPAGREAEESPSASPHVAPTAGDPALDGEVVGENTLCSDSVAFCAIAPTPKIDADVEGRTTLQSQFLAAQLELHAAQFELAEAKYAGEEEGKLGVLSAKVTYLQSKIADLSHRKEQEDKKPPPPDFTAAVSAKRPGAPKYDATHTAFRTGDEEGSGSEGMEDVEEEEWHLMQQGLLIDLDKAALKEYRSARASIENFQALFERKYRDMIVATSGKRAKKAGNVCNVARYWRSFYELRRAFASVTSTSGAYLKEFAYVAADSKLFDWQVQDCKMVDFSWATHLLWEGDSVARPEPGPSALEDGWSLPDKFAPGKQMLLRVKNENGTPENHISIRNSVTVKGGLGVFAERRFYRGACITQFFGSPVWISSVRGGSLPGVDYVRQEMIKNGFEAAEGKELLAMRDFQGRYYVVRLVPTIFPYERDGFDAAKSARTRCLSTFTKRHIVPCTKEERGDKAHEGEPLSSKQACDAYRQPYLGAHFIQVLGRNFNRYSTEYAAEVSRANAQMLDDGAVIALKQVDPGDEILLRCDALLTKDEIRTGLEFSAETESVDAVESDAETYSPEAGEKRSPPPEPNYGKTKRRKSLASGGEAKRTTWGDRRSARTAKLVEADATLSDVMMRFSHKQFDEYRQEVARNDTCTDEDKLGLACFLLERDRASTVEGEAVGGTKPNEMQELDESDYPDAGSSTSEGSHENTQTIDDDSDYKESKERVTKPVPKKGVITVRVHQQKLWARSDEVDDADDDGDDADNADIAADGDNNDATTDDDVPRATPPKVASQAGAKKRLPPDVKHPGVKLVFTPGGRSVPKGDRRAVARRSNSTTKSPPGAAVRPPRQLPIRCGQNGVSVPSAFTSVSRTANAAATRAKKRKRGNPGGYLQRGNPGGGDLKRSKMR